ncbi:PRC-barrel domain containing protein [Kitasatospora sp. NBC_01250]|uniref:PRC-barrel domain containing protein n=1 Tax=unclassified Kitasatospora TaxID=2633591 RepID=UPI002E144A85|nr:MULTISPECIES: PRC-barrel domain containing protein [unclassified Kitasatospora]WSJ65165.1 PRC-barrel domain containing protein [Kitasatospora sp. NBC_01302]
MSAIDIWAYRTTAGYAPGADLTGYHVEATDGHIGRIDKHSGAVGAAFLVVDTGPWIFGNRVLLPAGTVLRVDEEDKKVYVDRSKHEIKAGPEFDPGAHDVDTGYREKYGDYYARFYGGPIV